MAAPSVLSSVNWVFNVEHFKALIEAGFVERSDLIGVIKEENIEKVFGSLKQLFYWTRRMQGYANQDVLTLTLLGQDGLFKPDIKALHKKIFSILGHNGIVSINYRENSNFISLVMDCPEAASSVRQEVVELNGALVCYVDQKAPRTFKVRVLWSPLFYPLENVAQVFKQWSEHVELHFESDSFENGDTILNNRISGKITLRDGVSLSSIPHIVRLNDSPDNHILIIIRERSPLCLRCRHEGHIRKFCPGNRCLKCGLIHVADGRCLERTYAQTVGMGTQHGGARVTEKGLVLNASEKTPLINSHTDRVGSGSSSDATLSSSVMDMEVALGSSTRRITRSMVKKDKISGVDPYLMVNQSAPLVSNGFEHLQDEVDISIGEFLPEPDVAEVESVSSPAPTSSLSCSDSGIHLKSDKHGSSQVQMDKEEQCAKRGRDSDEDNPDHLTLKKSKDQPVDIPWQGNAAEKAEKIADMDNNLESDSIVERKFILEPWKPVFKWPIYVSCKYCKYVGVVVSQPYANFRCKNCPKHFTPDFTYNIIYMR